MSHPAPVTPPRLSTHATTSGNLGPGSQIGGVTTLPRLQVMSHVAVAPCPVTILVVDDESWVRDRIRRMLTYVGYSVLEASNAEHAMIVAERHINEIDLLVTNVMLPDMDGFDLAYCLRGCMKVLFVTGHAEDVALRRTGLRRTNVLHEPFRADELQRSVRRVLDAGRRGGRGVFVRSLSFGSNFS